MASRENSSFDVLESSQKIANEFLPCIYLAVAGISIGFAYNNVTVTSPEWLAVHLAITIAVLLAASILAAHPCSENRTSSETQYFPWISQKWLNIKKWAFEQKQHGDCLQDLDLASNWTDTALNKWYRNTDGSVWRVVERRSLKSDIDATKLSQRKESAQIPEQCTTHLASQDDCLRQILVTAVCSAIGTVAGTYFVII
jgi:hypothetical protein